MCGAPFSGTKAREVPADRAAIAVQPVRNREQAQPGHDDDRLEGVPTAAGPTGPPRSLCASSSTLGLPPPPRPPRPDRRGRVSGALRALLRHAGVRTATCGVPLSTTWPANRAPRRKLGRTRPRRPRPEGSRGPRGEGLSRLRDCGRAGTVDGRPSPR